MACSLQRLLPLYRYALPTPLNRFNCTQAAHLSVTGIPLLEQPRPLAGNLGWAATSYWSSTQERLLAYLLLDSGLR